MNNTGIKGLFTAPWQRMRGRYWSIMAALFLPMILMLVGMVVFGGLAALVYVVSNGDLIVLSILLGILAFVWMIVFSVLANVAAYYSVLAPNRVSFKECLTKGIKLFWPTVWIGALQMLIIYAAICLFAVPGIYLGLALMFALPILLMKGTKGFGAFLQSKDLVKGKWWALLGHMLLVGIVTYLPIIIFVIPAESENVAVFSIAMILLYTYQIFFYTPYLMSFIAEQYFWLESDKGGVPEVKDLKKRRIRFVILGIVGWLIAMIFLVGSIVQFVRFVMTTDSPMYYTEQGFDGFEFDESMFE
ncbi:MAG: hypothetical protein ABIH21_00370 [Patescibacteria group bacterium]